MPHRRASPDWTLTLSMLPNLVASARRSQSCGSVQSLDRHTGIGGAGRGLPENLAEQPMTIERKALVSRTRMKITSPPRTKYPSLGYCIYCGADGCTLSTEHIIPEGLGGNLEFEGASCGDCQSIINRFESVCLKQMFFHYRMRMGFPSKRKGRDWPSVIPVTVRDNGTRSARLDVSGGLSADHSFSDLPGARHSLRASARRSYLAEGPLWTMRLADDLREPQGIFDLCLHP